MVNTSYHLGYKAAQSLNYPFGEQAECISRPFTHFVTISFAETSLCPTEAVPAYHKFRQTHFNRWARRPNKERSASFPPTYAYVFENAEDQAPYGTIEPGLPHDVHVHWALHIRASRPFEFRSRPYGWLYTVVGDTLSTVNATEVQRITDSRGLRRYCLKGMSEITRSSFGETRRPQSAILSRRLGTSRNAGLSARLALDTDLGIRRQRVA